MRLLVDVNLSLRWVQFLGAAGFDVVHWSTVGALNAPDAQIMAYAAAQGSVVLTYDLAADCRSEEHTSSSSSTRAQTVITGKNSCADIVKDRGAFGRHALG